jgi:hypothetical protein
VYPREPLFRKLKELSVVQSKLPGQTRCVQSKLPGQNRKAEMQKSGRLAEMQKSGSWVAACCALHGCWQSINYEGIGDDVHCRIRPPWREADDGAGLPEVLVKFSCGCLVLVLVPVQVLSVDVPMQVLVVDVPVRGLIVDVPVRGLIVDVPVLVLVVDVPGRVLIMGVPVRGLIVDVPGRGLIMDVPVHVLIMDVPGRGLIMDAPVLVLMVDMPVQVLIVDVPVQVLVMGVPVRVLMVEVPVQVLIMDVPVLVLVVDMPVQVLIVDVPERVLIMGVPVRVSMVEVHVQLLIVKGATIAPIGCKGATEVLMAASCTHSSLHFGVQEVAAAGACVTSAVRPNAATRGAMNLLAGRKCSFGPHGQSLRGGAAVPPRSPSSVYLNQHRRGAVRSTAVGGLAAKGGETVCQHTHWPGNEGGAPFPEGGSLEVGCLRLAVLSASSPTSSKH